MPSDRTDDGFDDEDEDVDRPRRRRRRSRDETDYERDHRGGMILAFGIISLVTLQCGGPIGLVFGILAWVMGSNDLHAMDEREMDPAGRSLTKGGRVCGIIGAILNALYLIFVVLYIVGMVAFVGFANPPAPAPVVAPAPVPPPPVFK